MMIFALLLNFVAFSAFPESSDSIFAHENQREINIATSGSLGLYYGGKCHKTYGNETLVSSEEHEWCSNIAKDKNDPAANPFIQYSLKGKQMIINKYTVRNGCCKYDCCCTEGDGIIDQFCCCTLYSFSLRASNDNLTWKTLHKVEKDKTIRFCEIKTYELNEEYGPFTYLRLVLDEEWPNCLKCMQVNQIEFYGRTVNSAYGYSENADDEESISIIGRVKKNE